VSPVTGSPMEGLALRVLPMGDAAILVELEDTGAVLALTAALHEMTAGDPELAAVGDIVPAARTLLLVATPETDLGALAGTVRRLAARLTTAAAPALAAEHTIPVRYDGPDLDEVARLTGLSAQEVVAAHTGTPWRVGFGGFAPGFAYLVDGDPRLAVSRRAEPRPSVPAGSVGLAGDYSGIYPRASPGGWRLIGTTDIVLWDAGRDRPALLEPGDIVRFEAQP
jgi:KipI family sensor histidine kinase inhibitor